MTIEDAKVFLDNLKICINEHPIVADWLVEIADRETEPTISKMEQVDKDINVRSKTEPQTEYDKYREKIKAHDPHKYGFEDEQQTDCAWR